jgi:hypothetical protein
MPTAGSSKSRVASDRDRHHDRPPATTSLLNVYVNPLRKQLSPHVIETATAIDCTIE